MCLGWQNMGKIQPLLRGESFDATKIEQALQDIQAGNGFGKTVVCIPKDLSSLPGISMARNLSLDPEAAYLIVGGFGGLGKAFMTWLAEKGAQMLLVISPLDSKASEAEDSIAEVESLGCKVLEVVGEVQSLKDVERAIALVDRSIKGVIHLATLSKVRAVQTFFTAILILVHRVDLSLI